jgi:hypothetical protein
MSPVVALSGESHGGEFTSAFGRAAEVHGRTASAAFDANDPLRKSGGQKCCNAQHGFFDDVVGYDPRGLRKLMRRREFITLLGA